MTHKTIKPATTDERGQISDILYKSNFQHAAIIESNRGGLIRGNHYHKQTTQHIFITKGALRYWYQPLDRRDEVKSVLVKEYELVSTPPFEVHALEILEPTQFVVFSDGVRGGQDYESDTFRVTPILTPEMVGGSVKRFLVTGGTGFIGTALTRRLADSYGSQNVVAVGRRFDLERPGPADELFGGHGRFDYIVHLADVQGNAAWSAANAATQFMRNTAISWNVLRCWHVFQPQARMVTTSSLWAYPEATTVASEDQYWSGRMHVPTEHYGLGKKIMSMGIETHKRQFGMHGTTLALGSVYGPGDHSTHVIPSLIRRMRESPERLEVWGDGTERRQFIYIDDQVEGIVRHLDQDGELLNIGSETSPAIADVVRLLVDIMDYQGSIAFGTAPASTFRELDSRLARQVSGWPDGVSFVPLAQGLQKTVAAMVAASHG